MNRPLSILIILFLLISCAPVQSSPIESQVTNTPEITITPTATQIEIPIPATPSIPGELSIDIEKSILTSKSGTPVFRLNENGNWVPLINDEKMLLIDGELFSWVDETKSYALFEGLNATEFQASDQYMIGLDSDGRLIGVVDKITGDVYSASKELVKIGGSIFKLVEGDLIEVIQGIMIDGIMPGSEYWEQAKELESQLEELPSFQAVLSDKPYSSNVGLILTPNNNKNFDIVLVEVRNREGVVVGQKVVSKLRDTDQIVLPVDELSFTGEDNNKYSRFIISPKVMNDRLELAQILIQNPKYDDLEIIQGLGHPFYSEDFVDIHVGYVNSSDNVEYELFSRAQQSYLFTPDLWASGYGITGYYRKPYNVAMGTVTNEEVTTAKARLDGWINSQVSTARYGRDNRPLSEGQKTNLENTLRLLEFIDPASSSLIQKSHKHMLFSGITESFGGIAHETYIIIRGNYLTDASNSVENRMWLLNVIVHEHLHHATFSGNQAPLTFQRSVNMEIWVIEMTLFIMRQLNAPKWVLDNQIHYFHDKN